VNPADSLAKLHPLRVPEAVGWWPPAPGWWLLLVLLLAAAAVASWWLWRRHRCNAYRRQGLQELRHIREQWQQTGDPVHCLERVNALLKALALHAYPRRDVAAASGEQWRQFLNSGMPSGQAFSLDALAGQYQPQADATDVDSHLELVAQWIRHHRGQT